MQQTGRIAGVILIPRIPFINSWLLSIKKPADRLLQVFLWIYFANTRVMVASQYNFSESASIIRESDLTSVS